MGMNNINADPLFADADLRLLPGSSCIDAADNTALPQDVPDLDADGDTAEPIPYDLDSHARVLCGVVDMGAYESGIGDHDCDQDVDLNDFEAYLACVTGPEGEGLPSECEPFDFNGDNDVDFADLGGLQTVFTGQ